MVSSYLAEDDVLAIEPLGLGGAEEELGPVGVGSSVGHGENTFEKRKGLFFLQKQRSVKVIQIKMKNPAKRNSFIVILLNVLGLGLFNTPTAHPTPIKI